VNEFIRGENADGAVSLLKKERTQAKDPVPIGLLLAETLHSLRRSKTELEVLRQLVKEVPRSAPAWSVLAAAEVEARDLASAARSLHKVLELAPDSLAEKARLARLLGQLGKSNEADELLRELAEVPQGDVRAHVVAALIHVDELDEPGKALQLAERAYELAPEDASALDALGWALLSGDDEAARDRAISLLKRAATVGTDPLFKYHFGAGLIRTGKKDEGRNLIRTALRDAGEASWRATARSLIVP
jgi:Flp pilus assembly protein TadD